MSVCSRQNLAALSLSLLAILSGGARAAESPNRPNILLIITDQQSADAMSCRLGEKWLKTPSIDSLAARGMLFTRAYCANPLCVPSRTSMFTGRYPHETAVQTNDDKSADLAGFPCWGKIFQQAGYDTGYVGKWHLPFDPKKVAEHGFGYLGNIKGNGSDHASPAAAIEFLNRQRRGPFLLVVSLVNPHNICEWARGEELPDGAIGEPPLAAQCPPLRANLLPMQQEPDIVALMRRSYQATPTFPVSGFDETKWRQYAWAYFRMIEKVDALIGQVLDAVRRQGRGDETLIVFTSDHGDCQGAHRWNQKTILFEEAAGVPLIISWPGVTKVGTSPRLANVGIDLLPTLCDYAGLARPEDLPGDSLKAAANGQPDQKPRSFVVVANRMVQGAPIDGVKPEPEGRMLRGDRYKYTVYSLGQQRELLVDLQRDPGETVNLAGDPRYRDILQQQRQSLADWCRQYGDGFVRWVPTGP